MANKNQTAAGRWINCIHEAYKGRTESQLSSREIYKLIETDEPELWRAFLYGTDFCVVKATKAYMRLYEQRR